MTVVTPQFFDSGYTQAELDDLINDSPMSMLEFAQTSGLYSRFYGVLTGADEGLPMLDDQGQPAKTGRWERFVFTNCTRQGYWKKAFEAIAEMEALVNHRLSKRYVVETNPFPNSYVIQTETPGVAALNVARSWTLLDADVPLSPMIATDITMEQPYIGDGDQTWYGRIASIDNPNPKDVFFRRNGKGTIVSVHTDDSHPVERDGTDWLVPLDTRRTAYDPLTDVIDIQNKKFITVDIPIPVGLPAGAAVVPVYPGTRQIIPQAKERRTVGGNWRFTFYIYTLVHPEFTGSTVDLIAGEFYKLFPAIDFMYYREVAAEAVLIYTFGTETETYTSPALTASLVDGEKGIVHISYDNCQVTDPLAFPWCSKWGTYPSKIQLRLSYRVEPQALSQKLRAQVPAMKNAIVAKVAAELPTQDCGCEVNVGYIFQMQTAFNDEYINTYTGMGVTRIKHGQLQGQIIFQQAKIKALIFHRQTQPGLNISDVSSRW